MPRRGPGEEVPSASEWPSELREARRSAGLSQGALGKLVHVSAATVGGYELGKWQPPASMRAALERVLESSWPGGGQRGLNMSDQQMEEQIANEMAAVHEPEPGLGEPVEQALEEAVAEALEDAVEDAVEEAVEGALEEAVEDLVEEAEVEARMAGKQTVEEAEVEAEVAEMDAEVAELAALATLAEELRQRTVEAGRRAGKATAIEAELLLGTRLSEVYRRAFTEGLEE